MPDPASWTSALAAAAAGSAINAVLLVPQRPDAELLTMLFGQAVQRFPGSLGKAHLLTRAAHPIDAGTAPRPEQAAAWAVGAVLATELSRRWGRLIDLAESGGSGTRRLATALLSEQAGDQLHLDGTRCHARRIRRQLDAPDPERGTRRPRAAIRGARTRPGDGATGTALAGGQGRRRALLHLDEPATVPRADRRHADR